jgi:hypothetical protein
VLEAGEAPEHLVAEQLSELTLTGMRLVAAQQGLPLVEAIRRNGLTGGGPAQTTRSARGRARAHLLRQLEHNREADRIFVDLIRTTRALSQTGGDDAVRRWRNAAACRTAPAGSNSTGMPRHASPLRPDGYAEVDRDGKRYGFFLELDRGTENRTDYLRKLASYYEFWHSGQFRTAYHGMPVVLVVTTDTDVEQRIAGYARAAAQSRHEPLTLLLTTVWRLRGRDGHRPPPEGLLAPIWRAPDRGARGRWLPESSSAVTSTLEHRCTVLASRAPALPSTAA